MDISRREALQRLSVVVGGALSASTVGAVVSGVRAQPAAPSWVPEMLTARQADFLGTIVDMVIPPTDTPGASAAGVPAFIDKLLTEWVTPDERARFERGLAEIEAEFTAATPERRIALVNRLDREAVEARRADVDPLPVFATLKEWTLVGYYTSEIGATQELQWLAVPGRYEGDLPLEQVGRTWA